MSHHLGIPHRILHAMIRVKDLDRSVAFYRDVLGMRELRREDYPTGAFTLCFLGYSDEQDGTAIELTYNYGDKEYAHGSRFGHLAVAVKDIFAACDRLRGLGVGITREPGEMSFQAVNGRPDKIAFIQDPDGYRIELVQRL